MPANDLGFPVKFCLKKYKDGPYDDTMVEPSGVITTLSP
jgi:hypothetical protein